MESASKKHHQNHHQTSNHHQISEIPAEVFIEATLRLADQLGLRAEAATFNQWKFNALFEGFCVSVSLCPPRLFFFNKYVLSRWKSCSAMRYHRRAPEVKAQGDSLGVFAGRLRKAQGTIGASSSVPSAAAGGTGKLSFGSADPPEGAGEGRT